MRRIAVGASLIVILFVAYRVVWDSLHPISRTRSWRAICRSNLREVAHAMQLYNWAHGTLPPAYIADANGRPMHSWRVLLLPYLDGEELLKQYRFDEPWDGPNNRKLAGKMPSSYACPRTDGRKTGRTNYMVVVGENTAFPRGKPVHYDDLLKADGAGRTILLVETDGPGVNWLEPRDLDAATMSYQVNGPPGNSIGSRHKPYANVAFCSGRVTDLHNSVDPETVKQLIICNDRLPDKLPGEN